MIDEDPNSFQPQPKYVERFKVLSVESDIKFLKDEPSKNYLIIICPKLEDWLLQAAKEAKINVEDFSFPNNPTDLHRVINSTIDSKFKNFEALLGQIKASGKMVNTLEKFLKI